MNAKLLLTIAAIASASAASAADLGDPQQFALKFEGSRTRAEVSAEAATVAATRSLEPNGSRVAALPQSGLRADSVRAEAASAVRLGRIPSGEIGL